MCASPSNGRCKDDRKESEKANEEDDKELERLAVEALLKEAKKSKHRAEQVGALGWNKELAKTNKRFLSSTLANAVSSNRKRYRSDYSPEHRSRRHRREHSSESPERSPGRSRKRRTSDYERYERYEPDYERYEPDYERHHRSSYDRNRSDGRHRPEYDRNQVDYDRRRSDHYDRKKLDHYYKRK